MSKLITVEFHDDTLFALETPDGIWVAIKPIADRLGLAWGSQHNRLLRDPILAEGISVMKMPSVGGPQETTLLRLDLINGWLFGIDVDRAKPEVRDRVLAYKRECYAVLFRHFYGLKRDPAAVKPAPDSAQEAPIRVRRQLVAEAYRVFGCRAAGRLWFELGLPTVPEMHDGRRQGELGFTYTALPTPPAPPQGV